MGCHWCKNNRKSSASQMVSGLSMPVGFKNGTGGSVVVARDAVLSASYPHCFREF